MKQTNENVQAFKFENAVKNVTLEFNGTITLSGIIAEDEEMCKEIAKDSIFAKLMELVREYPDALKLNAKVVKTEDYQFKEEKTEDAANKTQKVPACRC